MENLAEFCSGALRATRDLVGEIVLHSESVLQILGVPPRWLVRWGVTAMVGVLTFLVSLAWLIHYPDMVPAPVVITMPVPPAIVVAGEWSSD